MIRFFEIIWTQFIYYLALLFFVLGSLFYNSVSILFCWLPEKPWVRRIFQEILHRLMQVYVMILQGSRAMRVKYDRWDNIPVGEGAIILANHPSMVDAPIILGRHSNTICFFKSSMHRNLLTLVGARMAGYVGNDRGIDGIRTALEHLKRGGWVLIFPEGTRTVGKNLLPFQTGYALLASRAKCPVVCLGITADSSVLSKQTKFWIPPQLPATFTFSVLGVVHPGEQCKSSDWINSVEAIYQKAFPPLAD